MSWEAVRYLTGIFSFAALASMAAMMRQGERITTAQKVGTVLVGGCIAVVVALWLLEDPENGSLKVASLSVASAVGVTTCWDFLVVALERIARARMRRLEGDNEAKPKPPRKIGE